MMTQPEFIDAVLPGYSTPRGPLTLVEQQQQWCLARRFARRDPFVWRVQVDTDTAYYFEDAKRAGEVFGATNPLRLEIAGEVIFEHIHDFQFSCIQTDEPGKHCRCGFGMCCGSPGPSEEEAVRESERSQRKRRRNR